MKAKIYILLLTAVLLASCEKEETPCLMKIEHYTTVPGKHKRILVFYAEEIPKGYVKNGLVHRFRVLEDCDQKNQ